VTTRKRLLIACSVVLGGSASTAASSASAQTTLPAAAPVTVNYTFDIPVVTVTPNPCTGGFTLISGRAHLAIAAMTSTTGFQVGVQLASTGTGIDVTSTGTPVVSGLPQYLYGTQVGATTTFPDGVPEYYERTLTASDLFERDSPIDTNDSYTMNTTLRLIFMNGLPSVPTLDSLSVSCQ